MGFAPVALFIGISLCACQNKSISAPVTFDKVAIDTTANLVPGDSTSPKAKIKITLVYAKGDSAQKVNNYILSSDAFKNDFVKPSSLKDLTPKNAVNKFVQEFIQSYRKECGPVYAKDKTSQSCNYEFIANGKAIDNGQTTSLAFDKYVYTGGANGMSSSITINVDKKDGEVISKEKLLKQISADKTKKEIVNSLVKQLKVKNAQQLHDSLNVFSDAPVYIPDNFIIGKDSITFIYGDLEIAPHYLGVLKAKVAKKDIMNK